MQVATKLLEDFSVNTNKLSLLAVATANIQNDAVTQDKIADDAIGTDQIDDNAVIGDHLSASAKQAVLESKLFAYPVKGFQFVTTNGANNDTITDFVVSRLTTKRTGGFSAGKGAITSAPDNRVTIREQDTNDPLQDANNREIFGRLTDVSTPLSGTLSFTNGSINVTGTGTLFLTEISPGDYIKLDSDGVLYKVDNVISDSQLEVETVFTGTTGSGAGSNVNIVISYFVDINGTETAHNIQGETIDIIFPEVFDLFTAPFNAPVVAIGFAEILAADHSHDDRYFTETELQTSSGTTGASLIGIDPTGLSWSAETTLQDVIEDIEGFFARFQRNELLNVSALNVIDDLTFTPADGNILLSVFGIVQRQGVDYNVTGKAVSWVPGSAGFDVDPGDPVLAFYQSTD